MPVLSKKDIVDGKYGDRIKLCYLKLEDDSKTNWHARMILHMVHKYGLEDGDFYLYLYLSSSYEVILSRLIKDGFSP